MAEKIIENKLVELAAVKILTDGTFGATPVNDALTLKWALSKIFAFKIEVDYAEKEMVYTINFVVRGQESAIYVGQTA